MGIFSRFTDIINSNISAILDKAEDPEKIVRLMIQEMEDTLVEVRSAAARTIADRKDLSRKLAALEAEAAAWQEKAELALDKNREDLARAALAEKAAASRSSEDLRHQLDVLSEGLERLNDDIASLEEKLSDAKKRQQALLARHQTASRRLQVRKKLHDYRFDDALVRFESFERRLDYMEGHVDAYDLGAKSDLAQEISDLASEETIERELQELKTRRGQQQADVDER